MDMRRLYTAIAFLFVALACTTVFLASVVTAQSAKALASKALPSVVLLAMEDSHGQPVSLGSGFIVHGDLIATNLHVIKGAATGIVKIIGKPGKYPIEGVLAVDYGRDLTVLRARGLSGPPLHLGDSTKVSIGEEVFVIGNPQGLEGTISQGIVSGIRQAAEVTILQITAPISPGSSGGPVLDRAGKVIGIAVATFRGGQNLNFAIPSTYLTNLLAKQHTLTPLLSVKTKKDAKPALGDIGSRSVEGVVTSNLVCEPNFDGAEASCSFSLVNKLNTPVRNIQYLVILYGKDGDPIDTIEGQFGGTIRPGLAIRPEKPGWIYSFHIKRPVNKLMKRIEIRILDFVVDQ
jgi:S1-C subfamily serine protease